MKIKITITNEYNNHTTQERMKVDSVIPTATDLKPIREMIDYLKKQANKEIPF